MFTGKLSYFILYAFNFSSGQFSSVQFICFVLQNEKYTNIYVNVIKKISKSTEKHQNDYTVF